MRKRVFICFAALLCLLTASAAFGGALPSRKAAASRRTPKGDISKGGDLPDFCRPYHN